MKIRLLLFILALSLIFSVFCNFENFNNVSNNGVWKKYRLGDCVKFTDGNGCSGPEDSIAKRYIKKMGRTGKPNYKVLNDLVPVKKSDYDVTIHLRVGDVVENSVHSVDDHWMKERKGKGKGLSSKFVYVRPKEYWEKISRGFPEGTKQIEIIEGGMLAPGKTPKSLDYIDRVKGVFTDKGYKVSVNGSENPDEDFTKLVNANVLVTSGGGFSNAAGRLVEMRDGILLS